MATFLALDRRRSGVINRIEDFVTDWKALSGATLRHLETLTDASLAQPVVDGHRARGRFVRICGSSARTTAAAATARTKMQSPLIVRLPEAAPRPVRSCAPTFCRADCSRAEALLRVGPETRRSRGALC
jgi:hypothetical protein